MNTAARRTLRPGGPAARHELAGLLASVWACEVVRPSGLLVLALPQLADGPALDNRGGSFTGVEPGWSARVVRVSDVLLRTAADEKALGELVPRDVLAYARKHALYT